jgi:hypothetical protein
VQLSVWVVFYFVLWPLYSDPFTKEALNSTDHNDFFYEVMCN